MLLGGAYGVKAESVPCCGWELWPRDTFLHYFQVQALGMLGKAQGEESSPSSVLDELQMLQAPDLL